MKTYKVALTRVYFVSIKAETKEKAKMFSEFYLGHFPDLSNKKDQLENNFFIEDIEMVYNEADDILCAME